MMLSKLKNITFKGQLFLLFGVSVIVISLIMAMTASWISNNHTKRLLIESGLQHTRSAALHSRLALLYKSSENAKSAANSILEFPDIIHVAIINIDMSILYETGSQSTRHDLLASDVRNITDVKTLNEDQSEWHFVAPVYSSNNENKDELFNIYESKQTKELIGYVYLSSSKNLLHETTINTLNTNIVLGLMLGITVLLILYYLLNYFLTPLNQLTLTMSNSIRGDLVNYSGVKGPAEMQEIATAYNNLVNTVIERDKKIQEYNESLEITIQERTKEIIEARDEAIRANKYKSEILSNTTHELRTPLQAIIGYVEVASEVALEAGVTEIDEDLKSIESNGKHLLSLINSILDMAKLENGALTAENTTVNLQELINDVETATMPLIEKNGNHLTRHINCNTRSVFMDKKKVFQILVNLVGNAAKFTKDGQITVYVNVSEDMLDITVDDTGIGIEPDKVNLIFAAFQQSNGSIVRDYGGTGLGLTVSKQFCELLGGSITVHSELGKGSTFHVSLPVNINL
ncbi:MAG: ATP-binding protein [Gammaproteobacteria bacterium]|nr:ATP-binding protein [Gammaproteobacteria bacterium]